MNPWFRRLRAACFVVLAIIALLVLPGMFASSSKGVIRLALWLSPGNVSVQSISGRLWDRIELHDVTINQKTFVLNAGYVAITFDARRWTLTELTLPHVLIRDVQLRLYKKKTDSPRGRVIHTLPIAINLEDVTFENWRIDDWIGHHLQIDHGKLAVYLSGTLLQLSSVAVDGSNWDLSGRANVELRNDFPINADVRWQTADTDGQLAKGSMHVIGQRPEYKLALIGQSPFVAEFTGKLAWPYDKMPTVALSGQWSDGNWPLWGAPKYTSKRGSLKIAGNIDSYSADMQLSLAAVASQNVYEIDFSVQGHSTANIPNMLSNALTLAVQTPHGWSFQTSGKIDGWFDRFVVDQKIVAPFPMDLKGQLSLANSALDKFQINLSWRDLRVPLRADVQSQLDSATGQLNVVGDVNSYQIDIDAMLAGLHVPSGHWSAHGVGDKNRIVLDKVKSETLAGEITGSAEFKLQEPRGWTAKGVAKNLNPGVKWPRLESRLSFDGDLGGNFVPNAEVPFGHVNVSNISGSWRDVSVGGNGAVGWTTTGVVISPSEVTLDGYHVTGQGRISRSIDMRLEAVPQDVAKLLRLDAGSMGMTLVFSGETLRPQVALVGQAADLRLGDDQIKQLSVTGDLPASGLADMTLFADMGGVVFARQSFDRGEFKIENPETGKQVASLNLEGKGKRSATLQLLGNKQNSNWTGKVNALQWNSQPLGRWSLERPVDITLGASSRLAEMCLSHGDDAAALCMQGKWERGGPWDVFVDLRKFDLNTIAESKSGRVIFGGAVKAKLQAQGKGSDYSASLKVLSPEGKIHVAETFDQTFSYNNAAFQAQFSPELINMSANAVLGEDGVINADARVSDFGANRPLAQGTLNGNVSVKSEKLSWLQVILPSLDHVTGKLDGKFRLSGTVSQPRLNGEAKLANGAAKIPDIGISLSKVHIAARSIGDRAIDITASARSGRGDLNVTGVISLPTNDPWGIKLQAVGKAFEVVDYGDTVVAVSPNLAIALGPHTIGVDGTVEVPYATVVTRELPANAVKTSRDAVYSDGVEIDTKKSGNSAWKIRSRVLVKLSDRVHFSSSNLSARIRGEVLAVDEPGRHTRGEGQLRILDGKYEAYGQKMDISRGRLVFLGAIDDPGLDVEATRKIGDLTAGVRATGTLKAPVIKPFSDPPRPDKDVVSYLLFGRPLDEANGKERNAVAAEIFVGFGLSQGSPLAKQIAERVGVEGLTVTTETENTGDSSVVFGGYLSPRVYISYGIGLFSSVNEQSSTSNTRASSNSKVKVRYKLSDKWSVEAGGGADNGGADLIYTFEH